ncbi:MAG: hypothetical protein ACXW3M_14430 [Rhodoplanes sp.]
MTAINKELYDALVAAGSPEDKASAAAATVKLAEDLATKADIALLRADLNALEARIYKVIGAQTIALVLAMVGLKLFG